MMLRSLALVALAAMSLPAHADELPRLRVMTFNLRYDNSGDGVDAWGKRKEIAVDCIKAANPDLLGTQEGLAHQIEYLSEQLPGYQVVGVGRDDGARKGEYSAIFLKTDRTTVTDSGTFWLSESPDKPGSKSWDSSLPRVVSWAKLSIKGRPDVSILSMNSHWDHRGPKARFESAKLMRAWVRKNAGSLPVVITGDFNCNEKSEPIQHMFKGDDRDAPWIDGYRQVHAKAEDDEASFHGFKGTKRGSRIDFILHTNQFRTIEAAIDRTHRGERYPSDHYPVTAVLELMNRR